MVVYIYICCIDTSVFLLGTPKHSKSCRDNIASNPINFLPFFIAIDTPKTNMEPWRVVDVSPFPSFGFHVSFLGCNHGSEQKLMSHHKDLNFIDLGFHGLFGISGVYILAPVFFVQLPLQYFR